MRDQPDVVFAAGSINDGWTPWVAEGRYGLGFGATSVAAPMFAGLAALLVQKTGQRQGNVNPNLYKLGMRQYTGVGPAVFNDVTSGDNGVPGFPGFPAGPGYDLATGLGSIDVSALLYNWDTASETGPCVPGVGVLCIDDQPGDRRFAVSVGFHTADQTGDGAAVSMASLGITQGGLFWFFGANNPEMLVKVLNGCAVNRKFWVFYAADTNVGLTLDVRDTKTGPSKLYTSQGGTAATPIQDTSAFDCTASDLAAVATTYAQPRSIDEVGIKRELDSAVRGGRCVPSSTSLCIDDQPGDKRFAVQVQVDTVEGGGHHGLATGIQLSKLGVNQGGVFWFFSATNPEMLIKVLNGCSLGGHFWVFFSATTNVGFAVTVTDTVTGHTKTYANPDLQPAQPIQDTSALACN